MEAGLGVEESIPPAPDAAGLHLTIMCRTSPESGSEVKRHPVTIRPDWSVEVPHDLEAERIAAAFGGFLSCLTLADKAVPALREWLRRQARLEPPSMRFIGAVDRWVVQEGGRCCPSGGFANATGAAEYWRSSGHVATQWGADRRQLATLAAASRRAHAATEALSIAKQDSERAGRACLRGAADVAWLWEAGIHPRLVVRIHGQVSPESPLPARFSLGVAWNRPDLRWVVDTLAGRDDPAEVYESVVKVGADRPHDPEPLSCWLAWSAANWDVIRPDARASWLETGISRPMILALGEAGYDPVEVVEHAQAVNRTPDGAARAIRDWVTAGYHPSPARLTELTDRGLMRFSVPPRRRSHGCVKRLSGDLTLGPTLSSPSSSPSTAQSHRPLWPFAQARSLDELPYPYHLLKGTHS